MTSLAQAADVTLLAPEDKQLHSELLQLEARLEGSIQRILSPANGASHAAVSDKELQQQLAALRSQIRDLELAAEEQETDEQTEAAERCLQLHQAEYDRLRSAIADAKVASRQAQERAAAQQRMELLAGASLPVLQKQYKSTADAVEGSAAVTESLKRTRAMLSQQLEQTSATMAVLDSGNMGLAATNTELQGHKGLHKQSTKLLNTLQKQEKRDRWLLWLGLLLFACTCAYIGYKRAPAVVRAPVDMALGAASRSAQQLWRQATPIAARHAAALSRQARQQLQQHLGPHLPPWLAGLLGPVASDAAGGNVGRKPRPSAPPAPPSLDPSRFDPSRAPQQPGHQRQPPPLQPPPQPPEQQQQAPPQEATGEQQEPGSTATAGQPKPLGGSTDDEDGAEKGSASQAVKPPDAARAPATAAEADAAAVPPAEADAAGGVAADDSQEEYDYSAYDPADPTVVEPPPESYTDHYHYVPIDHTYDVYPYPSADDSAGTCGGVYVTYDDDPGVVDPAKVDASFSAGEAEFWHEYISSEDGPAEGEAEDSLLGLGEDEEDPYRDSWDFSDDPDEPHEHAAGGAAQQRQQQQPKRVQEDAPPHGHEEDDYADDDVDADGAKPDASAAVAGQPAAKAGPGAPGSGDATAGPGDAPAEDGAVVSSLDAQLKQLREVARSRGLESMPPWLRGLLADDPEFGPQVRALAAAAAAQQVQLDDEDGETQEALDGAAEAQLEGAPITDASGAAVAADADGDESEAYRANHAPALSPAELDVLRERARSDGLGFLEDEELAALGNDEEFGEQARSILARRGSIGSELYAQDETPEAKAEAAAQAALREGRLSEVEPEIRERALDMQRRRRESLRKMAREKGLAAMPRWLSAELADDLDFKDEYQALLRQPAPGHAQQATTGATGSDDDDDEYEDEKEEHVMVGTQKALQGTAIQATPWSPARTYAAFRQSPCTPCSDTPFRAAGGLKDSAENTPVPKSSSDGLHSTAAEDEVGAKAPVAPPAASDVSAATVALSPAELDALRERARSDGLGFLEDEELAALGDDQEFGEQARGILARRGSIGSELYAQDETPEAKAEAAAQAALREGRLSEVEPEIRERALEMQRRRRESLRKMAREKGLAAMPRWLSAELADDLDFKDEYQALLRQPAPGHAQQAAAGTDDDDEYEDEDEGKEDRDDDIDGTEAAAAGQCTAAGSAGSGSAGGEGSCGAG